MSILGTQSSPTNQSKHLLCSSLKRKRRKKESYEIGLFTFLSIICKNYGSGVLKRKIVIRMRHGKNIKIRVKQVSNIKWLFLSLLFTTLKIIRIHPSIIATLRPNECIKKFFLYRKMEWGDITHSKSNQMKYSVSLRKSPIQRLKFKQ